MNAEIIHFWIYIYNFLCKTVTLQFLCHVFFYCFPIKLKTLVSLHKTRFQIMHLENKCILSYWTGLIVKSKYSCIKDTHILIFSTTVAFELNHVSKIWEILTGKDKNTVRLFLRVRENEFLCAYETQFICV